MTSLASVFVEVRPDTSHFSTELKANLARTREAVDVAAKLDTAKLRPQLDALKAELKSITVTKANIYADTVKASAQIKALKAEMKGLNEQVKIDVNNTAAKARIEEIKAEITSLTGGKARLAVDSSAASAHLKALQAQLAMFDGKNYKANVSVDQKGVNFAFRGISNLTTAIVGLAPIAVPALAAVTAGVGLLGSAFVSAGGAAGIWGGVVAGALAAYKTDAAKIQKLAAGIGSDPVKNARIRSQIKDIMAGWSAAEKQFDRTKEKFTQAFQALIKGTGPATFGVLNRGMGVLIQLMPRAVPIINAVGRAMSGLIGDFGRFTQTREFQRILDFFAKTGPGAIRSFAHIAGNLLLGVFNLFTAFAPQQKAFLAGFERMSVSFRTWSAGFGKSGGFQRFMAYAQRVLPDVRDLFIQLTEFIGKFIVALGPLGGIELKILLSVLRGLNSLPQGVLTVIAAGIAAIVLSLKAWEVGAKAVAIAQKVGTAYTWLFVGATNAETGARNMSAVAALKQMAATVRQRVATVANTIATKAAEAASKAWAVATRLVGVAMKFALGPVGLVILGVAALAAGLIYAYKHSATFHHIVVQAWQAVQDGAKALVGWFTKSFVPFFTKTLPGAFRTVVSAVTGAWTAVKNATTTAFRAVGTAVSVAWAHTVKPVLAALNAYVTHVIVPVFHLYERIGKLVFQLVGAAVWIAWKLISLAFNAMVKVIRGALTAAFTFLRDRVVVPVFNTVKTVISNAWKAISGVFTAIVRFIRGQLTQAFVFYRDRVVRPVFRTVQDIITFAWNRIIKPTFTNVINFIRGALTSAFTFFRDRVVRPVFTTAQTIVVNAWRGIKSTFTNVINFIRGALSTAFTFLRDRVVRPVFNGITSAISDAWNHGIRPIFGKIGDALGALKRTFRNIVGDIVSIWHGLPNALISAVNWIVNNVVNKLVGVVNTVGRKLGHSGNLVDPLRGITKRFDTGGYTGPGDKLQVAGVVHAREHVIKSESTESVNRAAPGFLDRLNKHGADALAGLGGYLQGGLVKGFRTLRGFATGGNAGGGGIYRPTATGSYGSQQNEGGFAAVDIGVPQGTPIHAGASGRVTISRDLRGPEPRNTKQNGYYSYGRYIQIHHAQGNTIYAHMVRRLAGAGTLVRGGELIGYSGHTGHTLGRTGDHLHFGANGSPSVYAYLNASRNYTGRGSAPGTTGGGGGIGGFLSAINPVHILQNLLGKIHLGNIPGGAVGSGLAHGILDTLTGLAKSKLTSLASSIFSGGGVNSISADLTGISGSVAKQVVQTGKRLGASSRDRIISLMTGLQESGLRNLPGGDRDSVGVFQQRAPWGPFSARHNVAQSTAMFFEGGRGGQRGLFDIHNRNQIGMGQAAQLVQVSAFPSAYDKWYTKARRLNSMFDGGGIAKGRGVMMKNIIEPERTLDPRTTVAFEKLVGSLTGDGGGKMALTITNWDTGQGYIRRLASDEVAQATEFANTRRRMR